MLSQIEVYYSNLLFFLFSSISVLLLLNIPSYFSGFICILFFSYSCHSLYPPISYPASFFLFFFLSLASCSTFFFTSLFIHSSLFPSFPLFHCLVYLQVSSLLLQFPCIFFSFPLFLSLPFISYSISSPRIFHSLAFWSSAFPYPPFPRIPLPLSCVISPIPLPPLRHNSAIFQSSLSLLNISSWLMSAWIQLMSWKSVKLLS